MAHDESTAHLDCLTVKERGFVLAYMGEIGGGNATKAAVTAGYAKGGSAARVAAHRALKRRKVQHAIEVEKKLQIERMRLEKDRILREEACIALLDPRALFSPEGRPLRPSEMPEHVARAVASYNCVETETTTTDKDGKPVTTKTTRIQVKLQDKGGSLMRVGKHLGLYTDVNMSGSIVIRPAPITKPAASGLTEGKDNG